VLTLGVQYCLLVETRGVCIASLCCWNDWGLDMQVPQELTSLRGLVPDGWAFEASTDQMPGVWATADHQVCPRPTHSAMAAVQLGPMAGLEMPLSFPDHA
jgi:hypothetical protein